MASRCRLAACILGSPQGSGVVCCCLGLRRLPRLLKTLPPSTSGCPSRSSSAQTTQSPLPLLSCPHNSRPRLLTNLRPPSLLFPLQPHLHSRPHRWKMLASHSQPLLLPAHCQPLMTFTCWSERCILTAGLEILLLISRKADASIATGLPSLRFGLAGAYREPPFGRLERMYLRSLPQSRSPNIFKNRTATYFGDAAISLQLPFNVLLKIAFARAVNRAAFPKAFIATAFRFRFQLV
jgi:hypothetical protein